MDNIAILDFGGQYTHLISRKVRSENVFSEVFPCEEAAGSLRGCKGIILSGGPSSVYEPAAPRYDPAIFDLGIPVLGICYGMQLVAHDFGGKVVGGLVKEYGKGKIRVRHEGGLLDGLSDEEIVWMSHGDSIIELPNGFEALAYSDNDLVAAFWNPQRRIYGVQFHPEVTHTPKGWLILRNFIRKICQCKPDWTLENYIQTCRTEIRQKIGNKKSISFVSGGVDSTVATALAAGTEKIGQIQAVYVETGLMRKDEESLVRKTLEKGGVKKLIVINAAKEFISMLRNIEDPEQKRKLIGDKFAEIFENVMSELKADPEKTCLIQGTLYTDTIESGHGVGNKADIIKTHHNVGSPRIKMMRDKGLVVEPNRWIYKDEVRMVGQLLGLPEEVIWRHPFPGPALAVRLICASKPYFTKEYYHDNSHVVDIARKYGLKGIIYPIRTVGVQGDERTYKNLVLLSGPSDWQMIRQAAVEIIATVHSVNRAAFLIAGDFPENIDRISALHISSTTLDILREADNAAHQVINNYGLMRKISQMPVIMFPGRKRPMIAIRDVITDDFMTVRPLDKPDEMPWDCVFEMAEKIMSGELIKRTGGLDGACIDVTDKPPATVEWE